MHLELSKISKLILFFILGSLEQLKGTVITHNIYVEIWSLFIYQK
jgi:hypothetical protein